MLAGIRDIELDQFGSSSDSHLKVYSLKIDLSSIIVDRLPIDSYKVIGLSLLSIREPISFNSS